MQIINNISLERLRNIKDKRGRFIFCHFCGKPLSKQQILWRCKYCCHYCSEQAQRKRELITHCRQCNKRLTQKQIKYSQKFCSRKCSGKYNSENGVRTYGYDTDFLDTATAFRDRFLGLFVTDGSMPKVGTCISFEFTDRELIDQIVEETNYSNKVTIRHKEEQNENWNISYAVSFHGPPVKALKKMGFEPGPKSHKIFVPTFIKNSRFCEFLCATIDGDGCFYLGENRLICSIASKSKKFLEQIHSRLKEIGVVTRGGIYPNNITGVYDLQFQHHDSVAIGYYIYDHVLWSLTRKRKVWEIGKDFSVKEYNMDHPETCTIEGCNRPYLARGVCTYHYDQLEDQKEKNKQWVKNNPEKVKAAQKRHYDTHQEQRIENSRKWKEENPEKDKARQKAYYEEHKEERIANSQKWIKENPEKYKKTMKNWRKKNREKLNKNAKEWRNENPERSKEINKKSRDKNRDKINAETREDRKKNPEKYKAYDRNKRLKNPEETRRKDRERYQRRKQKKLEPTKNKLDNPN